jgi:hypothetical protein
LVHVAVLVVWGTIPFLVADEPPIDLLPAIVAGELGPDALDDVYIDESHEAADPPPAYVAAHCERAATYYDEHECASWALPFGSTPPPLAASMALSRLDTEVAALLVRFLGVACFAAGAHVMWRRLSRHGAAGAVAAAATTAALTPAVYVTARAGQTTPVVFLAAALGLAAVDLPRRRVAGAAVLVAAVAWKLFPLAALWVPVVERRLRYLVAVVGVTAAVVAATALVVPFEAWGEFWTASNAFDGYAREFPDNASLDTVLAQELDIRIGDGLPRAASLAARLAALVALGWWGLRRAGTDARWAWSIAAVLLVAPVLWAHYAVLVVPAVAAAVGEAAGRTGRLDPARWVTLPLFAAACSAFVDGPTLPRIAIVVGGAVVAARLCRHAGSVATGPPAVAAGGPG